MRWLRVGLPLVLALTLVGGCGGKGHPKAADSGTPVVVSQTDLATYFDAVASYDPAKLVHAVSVAAPGSPAVDYLGYLTAYTRSATEGDRPVTGAEAKTVDDGFQACGGSGAATDCVTWADFRGQDGKLADFTVNEQRLDDGLVALPGSGLPGEKFYEAEPRYAYRSPQSGTLFVLVEVTAMAHDLTINPTGAHYDVGRTELVGVDDRGPSTVPAGESRMVDLAFPHAGLPLSGDVSFEITVPGHDVITYGFGLRRT